MVLRSATSALRVAALAVVTASLFLGSTATGSTRVTQLVCFAVGTLTLAGWAGMSWRRPAEHTDHGSAASMVFLVMAAASLPTATAHGGALISFALLAAVAAGAATGLGTACAVTTVGILAIISGAVATGAAPVGTLGDCLEVIVALLLGRSRRSYRIQAEQAELLLAQAEQLRAEQAQVATLGERARIAREIHDVLAHSLGALGIQIQAARAVLSEQQDVPQAITVLQRAQRIASEGLDETRRAVHALRTDSRPLEEELAGLAETHRLTHGVSVDLEVDGPRATLAPDATVALLRIAQESLVNAAKHSPGQPITLTLTYESSRTRLAVTNALTDTGTTLRNARDAGGVDELVTIDGGYGLIGMRERLLLLNGSLTARARADRWEVAAQVPR